MRPVEVIQLSPCVDKARRAIGLGGLLRELEGFQKWTPEAHIGFRGRPCALYALDVY
jgi:hypothetical protein